MYRKFVLTDIGLGYVDKIAVGTNAHAYGWTILRIAGFTLAKFKEAKQSGLRD